MYALDVISPCETWLVEAVTRLVPLASVSTRARTQQTALAGASFGRGLAVLAFARARLAVTKNGVGAAVGSTARRPKVLATSVSYLRVRIQRVASLRAVLSQLRVQLHELTNTEALVDPTNLDFNPQSLNLMVNRLQGTELRLRSVRSTISAQPTESPFDRPVRRLTAADSRLQEAASDVYAAVSDLQAGTAGAASAHLDRARAATLRAGRALKRARILLRTICASAC